MSILKGKQQTDPMDVPVPQLADDPGYATETALLMAFERRKTQLERDKQRLELEAHLHLRSPDPKSPADVALRARLTKLQAEAEAEKVSTPPASGTSSPAIAAAVAILNGESPQQNPDRAAQIAEIIRQIAALNAAIREQSEARDGIAAELTLEYCQRLQPVWNILQLEMFRAAQELARSARRVREFRAKITAAGIGSRSDILAMPNVRAPLVLGDESVYDSEISGWRRILERLGILG
jgi:hypothetical protein